MLHADEAGFHIQCGLQGCKRTFRNFHSYRNHIYSMHDESSISTNQVVEDEANPVSDNEEIDGSVEESLQDQIPLAMHPVVCLTPQCR